MSSGTKFVTWISHIFFKLHQGIYSYISETSYCHQDFMFIGAILNSILPALSSLKAHISVHLYISADYTSEVGKIIFPNDLETLTLQIS